MYEIAHYQAVEGVGAIGYGIVSFTGKCGYGIVLIKQ